ncbi:LysR family transcriptional regulator [Duganella sp. FT92W]|uniref:LysR family transcriptional regulator n=1 Tax=Pseudoduganella rivuli TaxID=2666085 RepID=A0A7X2LQP9_9BURK|nr:LysR substrate-binding domain-containing protein [Pseudoduganella rivuli]MRV71595.1 LysR family transcriptional regulator [Pseudoduganella rivuli]
MKNLTLRALQVFEATATVGSFSKAALMLNLTQPAVSMQIKQLEGEIGAHLFVKQSRSATLTDSGRVLLTHARDILGRVQVAEAALATLSGKVGKTLHIGAISSAHYFAPWLMQAFQHQYPQVRMKLSVGERSDMLNALSESRLDLVIAGFPPAHTAVDAEPFAAHPHCMIAAPGHRLVALRNIDWADLKGEPFVNREAGSMTRHFFDYLVQMHKLEVDARVEFQGNEAVKQAVMAGMGISFMSAHAFQIELEAGRLVVLKIRNIPKMLDWCILRRRSGAPSGAAALFRSFVLERGAELATCRTA